MILRFPLTIDLELQETKKRNKLIDLLINRETQVYRPADHRKDPFNDSQADLLSRCLTKRHHEWLITRQLTNRLRE